MIENFPGQRLNSRKNTENWKSLKKLQPNLNAQLGDVQNLILISGLIWIMKKYKQIKKSPEMSGWI